MTQDPGVIGYIYISATHSTLDQTLNARADNRDCYVWPYDSADSKKDIAEPVFK